MVFKRRDKRPIWKVVADFLYPRGGWLRAFEYVKHRVRRLPDSPEKIARGIWAGVFTAFTPFYGFHFLIAVVLAKVMRGNILASLLATFFGNPLTYVPIAVSALGTGYWLLDRPFNGSMMGLLGKPDPNFCGLGCRFSRAFNDIGHNIKAIFTPERAHWNQLIEFYHEVFFPYLVGGILPGVVAATVSYYLSVPLIRAYQQRRRNKLREKLQQLGKMP